MADKAAFVIKPLEHEDRTAFQSTEPALNSYLLERSKRDIKNNISAVFILVSKTDPDRILGYYTLSTLAIQTGELPEELKKKTGRYDSVGATLIGRLAVDRSLEGQGFGSVLLAHALRQAASITETVASFTVLVDTKNARAVQFYEKKGFRCLRGKRYFLPMATVKQLSA